MGKPTGFLEYQRSEDLRRDPAERVKDWEEFHIPQPEEVRRQQGARCMNCGVPFCQTGMIYEGKAFGCPTRVERYDPLRQLGPRSQPPPQDQ